MNLKKLERYLRVNMLEPGPRLMKKEFTGSRSHKDWETLLYATIVVGVGLTVRSLIVSDTMKSIYSEAFPEIELRWRFSAWGGRQIESGCLEKREISFFCRESIPGLCSLNEAVTNRSSTRTYVKKLPLQVCAVERGILTGKEQQSRSGNK